jgi:DNA-binding transcriptional MocR family regulator
VPLLPGPGVISLARGVPAPEMFPVRELAEASRLAFRDHSATALNYGPPAGFRPLQEWLAGQARWSVPAGGYFLWLELPDQVRSEALLPDAERAGVTFVPGPGFFADGRGQNAARLAFSFPSVGDILTGSDRLTEVVPRRLACPARPVTT